MAYVKQSYALACTVIVLWWDTVHKQKKSYSFTLSLHCSLQHIVAENQANIILEGIVIRL